MSNSITKTDIVKSITTEIKFADRHPSQMILQEIERLKKSFQLLDQLPNTVIRSLIPSIKVKNTVKQLHNEIDYDKLEQDISITLSRLIYSTGRYGIHGYINEICRQVNGLQIKGIRFNDELLDDEPSIKYAYDFAYKQYKMTFIVYWAGISPNTECWEFKDINPSDVGYIKNDRT